MSMLSPGGYSDAVRGTRFQRLALDRVSRVPGVQAAAWATTLPLVDGPRSEFATSPTGALAGYRTILVSTSYFRMMQLDVIAGRSFESEEEVAYAPAVVVNAALAARLFPDGLSGARLFEKDGSAHPVLGVVSDGRYRQMEGYAEPTVYRPMSIEYTAFLHLLVRGTSDASTLMPAIRATLDGIDQASVSREESLEVHIAGALGRDRVAVVLVEACGLLVMVLSLSGAYLLATSLAARRRREMAVRLALGSTRRGLVLAMVERTLAPTVVGVGLGAVSRLRGDAGPAQDRGQPVDRGRAAVRRSRRRGGRAVAGRDGHPGAGGGAFDQPDRGASLASHAAVARGLQCPSVNEDRASRYHRLKRRATVVAVGVQRHPARAAAWQRRLRPPARSVRRAVRRRAGRRVHGGDLRRPSRGNPGARRRFRSRTTTASCSSCATASRRNRAASSSSITARRCS